MTSPRKHTAISAKPSSLRHLVAVNLFSLVALAIAFSVVLSTVTGLRQLFRTEVNHTVAMAAKSFIVGKSFLLLESEIQSLHGSYLHDPGGIVAGSENILDQFDDITMEASTSDNFLRQGQGVNILRNYRRALALLMDDEIAISKDILALDNLNRLFLDDLAAMEDHIAMLIMDEVLAEKPTTGLLQINALIPFCREQILHARYLAEQAVYDHNSDLLVKGSTPTDAVNLTTVTTNLRQTLSTMTSADPIVAKGAESILDKIPLYQKTVAHLGAAMDSVNRHSKETARTKNDILHLLNQVDQTTFASLQNAEQTSSELLNRASRTIYTVAILICIVSLVGGTLVHLIGRQLSRSAKSADAARRALNEQVIKLKSEIAGRRAAEEEISNLNESLELIVKKRTQELTAANEELTALISAMSHDLRTPLRGIAGFSHALREEYGNRLDSQGEIYLNRVQEACLRAGDTIDTILELSRLSRCRLQVGSVDMSGIVHAVIDELKRNSPERQVAAVIAPTPPIQADPNLIRALLEALVDNAWKFTSHIDKAVIQFSHREQDGKRIYFIKDNGAGFNMAFAGKLFTPFQRLHSPDEFPGHGIGLAIAHRIVKRYQGEIWAHGRENSGASFFFTLPDSTGNAPS